MIFTTLSLLHLYKQASKLLSHLTTLHSIHLSVSLSIYCCVVEGHRDSKSSCSSSVALSYHRNEEGEGSCFYENSVDDDDRSYCSHKEGSHEQEEVQCGGHGPCGLCCLHNEQVGESYEGFYTK